uniref:Uncharacterized protein n=1 Tax=Anguilla anguilla TaxID=7936 RepID=A0A0E9W8K7_ANGAN
MVGIPLMKRKTGRTSVRLPCKLAQAICIKVYVSTALQFSAGTSGVVLDFSTLASPIEIRIFS